MGARQGRKWVAVLGLLVGAAAGAHEVAGANSVACFVQAERNSFLTDNQALRLCLGATSVAPALCYEQAHRQLFITDEAAIQLCRCATSAEPVQCFELAQAQTGLFDVTLVQLCAPSFVYGLMPNCQPAVPVWPVPVAPR